MILTRILAVALALALLAAAVQTWRVGGLTAKVATAEAKNAQLGADLLAQRDALADIRRNADAREARAKIAIEKAQREARQAHRSAQTLMALPKPQGDECAAASDLIRKELAR